MIFKHRHFQSDVHATYIKFDVWFLYECGGFWLWMVALGGGKARDGQPKKRDRVGLWVGGGLGGFLCNVVNGRDCHDSIQELHFLAKVD